MRRRWLLILPVVLLVIFFSLTRGSVRGLHRAFWPAPAASTSSWAEVLARPPVVELVTLDTGEVHVARTKMLADATGYVEEPTPLHVFAHLIRHPRFGDVLIDSGLDATFASDDYGNFQRPSRWVLALLVEAPYSQPPGFDIATQLARLGSTPKSLFLTHLHMDHTAGIPVLPASMEVVTGVNEADDPPQIFGFGHFAGRTELKELDFARAASMPPMGPAIDIFGDGSLWALSTPGHSRGHISFLVNAKTGPVLLTGDAVHFRWGFEHDRGPQGTYEKQAQRSLDQLRALAKAFPQLTVFTGHERPE